jgi:hypothetical protein
MKAPYKSRVIEAELRRRLASAGAVVIEGPKACGKTATAETLAASVVLLDVDEQARRAADVDAVVEAQDGRWAAFEVKLGQAAIDEAGHSLRRFADRIDTKKCGEPAVLGVITGNGFAYVRPDGVAVIPIGSLGP